MRLTSINLLVLWGAVAFSVTASVGAQNITSSFEVFGDREGADITNLEQTPVGVTECFANLDVRVQFTNVPTSSTFLDFWSGGDNVDCSLTENRSDADGARECTHLFSELISSRSQLEVTKSVQEYIECDDSAGGKVTIYALATDSEQSEGDVASGQFAFFEIFRDFLAPIAPPDVEGGTDTGSVGNTALPISWTAPENQNQLEKYTLYKSGSCSVLANGDGPTSGDAGVMPDDMPVIAGTSIQDVSPSSNSATLSGASLGLDFGEGALVYVTATDRAGNESEPSAGVCMQRENVQGFCQTLGECEDCSVGKVDRHLGLVLLSAFGCLIAFRRRKSCKKCS